MSSSSGNNESYQSILVSFIKQLASATGDLSNMTCPAMLLSGTSLTEYSMHWCDHPDILAETALPTSPEERILAVTKWMVSTLYGAYASRWTKSGNEKKPFNPVLGEQFFAKWNVASNSTFNMYCEQVPTNTYIKESNFFLVSHHPPVTAFYFRNDVAGVYVNGHCGQKTRLTPSAAIKVEQTGNLALYIKKYDEEYVISYPELHLRGILTGSMFVDLGGSITIVASTGLEAKIEFLPKPWIGGEYHCIRGQIKKSDSCAASSDVKSIFSLTGKWNDKIYFSRDDSVPGPGTNPSTSKSASSFSVLSSSSKSDPNSSNLLYDSAGSNAVEPIIEPVERQGDMESRRLWHSVKEALDTGDYSKASKEKSDIEEKQRALRREREESGIHWNAKFFRFVPNDILEKNGPGSAFKMTPEALDTAAVPVIQSKKNSSQGLDGRWIYTGPLN